MRLFYVLLGALLVGLCAGCSDDPNSKYISETISILGSTTSGFDQLSKTINDAVADAKKDNKPLDFQVKILKAKEQAKELGKLAEKLQKTKAETDTKKDAVTPEKRAEYDAKFRSQFQQAMIDVYAAENRLDAALKEAKNYNEQANVDWRNSLVDKAGGARALEDLDRAIQDSKYEFESLTKRQS